MIQSINATDRVREEVLSLLVHLNQANGHDEVLSEIFVAPTPIVRAFAEFLSQRDELENFHIKDKSVRFEDLSVSCGDSNQAVLAFECLRHYDVPLGNYKICDELIRESEKAERSSESGSLSSQDDEPWTTDKNFTRFKEWYVAERMDDARHVGDDMNE